MHVLCDALMPRLLPVEGAPFPSNVDDNCNGKVRPGGNIKHFVPRPRPVGLPSAREETPRPPVGLQVGVLVEDVKRDLEGTAVGTAVDERALPQLVHPVVPPRVDHPVRRQSKIMIRAGNDLDDPRHRDVEARAGHVVLPEAQHGPVPPDVVDRGATKGGLILDARGKVALPRVWDEAGPPQLVDAVGAARVYLPRAREEDRVLLPQREHHPPGAGDYVSLLVRRHGDDARGVVDVCDRPGAQLPLEVDPPEVCVSLSVDGPAVEGARRDVDEARLLRRRVHKEGRGGEVALRVVGGMGGEAVGRHVGGGAQLSVAVPSPRCQLTLLIDGDSVVGPSSNTDDGGLGGKYKVRVEQHRLRVGQDPARRVAIALRQQLLRDGVETELRED
mmetsp:Transcript_26613/g.67602  ORF Transcript_26613/g.67602 Transcript_26613/m.67602 type:complete len:388 (+) Transcript_26613:2390-3553(+)